MTYSSGSSLSLNPRLSTVDDPEDGHVLQDEEQQQLSVTLK